MNRTKKILLATDHAGFDLKENLKPFLLKLGYVVEDKGAFEYNSEDDYPDFISKAVQEVSENPTEFKAIILGASGQGEAMLANRFKNIRATVCYSYNLEIVKLSREHNNANVLSLGAQFLTEDQAKEIIELWLKTNLLEDEKYSRRIQKAENLT